MGVGPTSVGVGPTSVGVGPTSAPVATSGPFARTSPSVSRVFEPSGHLDARRSRALLRDKSVDGFDDERVAHVVRSNRRAALRSKTLDRLTLGSDDASHLTSRVHHARVWAFPPSELLRGAPLEIFRRKVAVAIDPVPVASANGVRRAAVRRLHRRRRARETRTRRRSGSLSLSVRA